MVRGLILNVIAGLCYAGWSGFGVLAMKVRRPTTALVWLGLMIAQGGKNKDTPQFTSLAAYGVLFYFHFGVLFAYMVWFFAFLVVGGAYVHSGRVLAFPASSP